MMVEFRFQCYAPGEVERLASAVAEIMREREAAQDVAAAGTPSVAEPEKPKAARTRATKAKAEPTEKPAEQPAAPAPAASPAPAADAPSLDDVVAKVQALHQKVGVPGVIALLKTFDVKRAGELKPEQYAAFISAADAELAK